MTRLTTRLGRYRAALALALAFLLPVPAQAQSEIIRDSTGKPVFAIWGSRLSVADLTAEPVEIPGRFIVGPGLEVGNDEAVAAAQRAYAPNELATVKYVDERCPGLIWQDHAFTDAVFSLLHSRDPKWGRNGKRGNPNDPSHDAGSYQTPTSPFGVAVIDIIGCAGGAADCSPFPAWIDQTDATIAAKTTGVWVRPSGRLPACLSGTTPTPVPDPGTPAVVTPPSPTVDLTEVLVALSRIDDRLAAIENRQPPETETFRAYVDDMVGAGPADDPRTVPNHVTDLKQRLDSIYAMLEQLQAWLRGRAVLRY